MRIACRAILPGGQHSGEAVERGEGVCMADGRQRRPHGVIPPRQESIKQSHIFPGKGRQQPQFRCNRPPPLTGFKRFKIGKASVIRLAAGKNQRATQIPDERTQDADGFWGQYVFAALAQNNHIVLPKLINGFRENKAFYRFRLFGIALDFKEASLANTVDRGNRHVRLATQELHQKL